MSTDVPGRRPRATWAVAAAAILLALLGASRASAQGLTTGVTNTYETSRSSMAAVTATGAGYISIPLEWNVIAPGEEPASWNPEDPGDSHYSWGSIDEPVKNAIAAGLTPVLHLGGTPTWAAGCTPPPSVAFANCIPDPAKAQAFAVAAARHFSGRGGVPRVRYWQVFNEPNLTFHFFPQFNTAGKPLAANFFRPLLNAAYAGFKSVSRSNVVIAAGLAPVKVPQLTVGPMQFTRELLCMTGGPHPRKAKGSCEGGVHFDVFAIHPYTSGGPTHEGSANDVELGDLDKLQNLIAAADRAGRIKNDSRRTPLWITEFSWDTKPPDPGGLPMKIEVRWVAEALHTAWKAGVSKFFWYSLHDAAHKPGSSYDEGTEGGLYFGPGIGKPKPILAAFRFPFVAYPGKGGLEFWGKTPANRSGRVAIQVRQGSGWRTVARAAAAGGIFRGTWRSDYGSDREGAARAVLAGEVSPAFAMKPVPDFEHDPFGG